MSKIKVLKFWAPWCKPCTALSKMLEGLDITSHNIDDAESSPLVSKFRVRSIPLLVFLKDGEEVHRHVGIISKAAFTQTLERLNEAGSISQEETIALEVVSKLEKE